MWNVCRFSGDGTFWFNLLPTFYQSTLKENAFWFVREGFIWFCKYRTYFGTCRIYYIKCLRLRCFPSFLVKRTGKPQTLPCHLLCIIHLWRPLIVFYLFFSHYFSQKGFPGGSNGKEFACSAGDLGLTPGLERSPGEGNGYPIKYSCLSMDREAWQTTVLGHKESDI